MWMCKVFGHKWKGLSLSHAGQEMDYSCCSRCGVVIGELAALKAFDAAVAMSLMQKEATSPKEPKA